MDRKGNCVIKREVLEFGDVIVTWDGSFGDIVVINLYFSRKLKDGWQQWQWPVNFSGKLYEDVKDGLLTGLQFGGLPEELWEARTQLKAGLAREFGIMKKYEIKTKTPAFKTHLVMKFEVGTESLRGQWILTCMDKKFESPYLAVDGKIDAELFDDLWGCLNGYAILRSWADQVNQKTHDDWLLLCDNLNEEYTRIFRDHLKEVNKEEAKVVPAVKEATPGFTPIDR